jgi:hypothetical protein
LWTIVEAIAFGLVGFLIGDVIIHVARGPVRLAEPS